MSASTTKLLVLLLLTGTLVSAGGVLKKNKTKEKKPKNEIEMTAQNQTKTCSWCRKKKNNVIKVVHDTEEEKIETNEFTKPLIETNVAPKMINGATYENVTPTNDPIAVFKKIDEDKFFLEDPKNLLDPAINGYKMFSSGNCPTIDFSTATWGNVFEYSIDMRFYLRHDRFNHLFSENTTEFMKALAINAAKNCPLDFKVGGFYSPLRYAVYWNDVDAASVLLQRGAVIETKVLADAIVDLNLEMVKILLENGADVHAETDWGERPQPIHEWCAQRLQRFGTYRSLDELEKMREINKFVMDKKEKTTI